MLKALAWKEWREQRPVVIAGVAISITMPFFVMAGSMVNNDGRLDRVLEPLLFGIMGGWWPLLGAAAGSITIANEDEGGTIRFLLSRPVSRTQVWLAKVSVAAVAWSVVAVLSLLVVAVVDRLLPAGASVDSLAFLMGTHSSTIYDPLALTSISCLLFACSVFCSTLLNRTLTAATAGIALALILLSGIMLAWTSLSLSPALEPQWVAFEVVLLSVVILLASVAVFARGELFARSSGSSSSGAGRGGRPLLVAAGVVTLCIVGLPIVLADAVMTPEGATVDPGSLSFDGRTVAMTMVAEDEGTTQVWLVYPDSSGARPLAGRHTFAPTFAPGARWVAYLSWRGATGGRSGSLDLRVADIGWNEQGDRLVYAGMPGERQLFFKGRIYGRLSSNNKVAFSTGVEVTVAQLNGRGTATYDVRGTPLENAVILGFINRGLEDELLFVPAGADLAVGGERPATALLAHDLGSGTTRTVRELDEGWSLPTLDGSDRNLAGLAQSNGWELIPVITGTKLELIDVRTGEAWDIHEFDVDLADPEARQDFRLCSFVEKPPDRRWPRNYGDDPSFDGSGHVVREEQILFGDCTAQARAEALERFGPTAGGGLIRLRGVETGNERVWPLPTYWEDSVVRVYLDQPQQNVLLDVRAPRRPSTYAMVIGADGTGANFPVRWAAQGWIDRDWVLLTKEEAGTVQVARGQVSSRRVRGLFPVPGQVHN